MKDKTKRNITFCNTDSSLTSDRVKVILSSREDSDKLADAVRRLKRGEDSTFKVTKETSDRINKLGK